mmetsp:Transcript_7729/g.15858  ORF Transcript_7729/g.15858 Transcript_7729/m.15858 type:complete len:439 (-) Transcript_7729:352-1668(-)|eukprot:CAMPEP_0171339700 /NCGR_PEP_ID=MMETSP0878-20121228/8097_1 /TAXON_ID=67004 /ORGANISM="Thalassiosira weissflogii, Strain CCMP1336" /LENGTH=438 /DNA_ID=CAMNT_0011841641 /DNA_START=32 /DNA_END=1348 /DNA_ORIENTATION=+
MKFPIAASICIFLISPHNVKSFTHPIPANLPQSWRKSTKSSAACFELRVATRTVSNTKIKAPIPNEVSPVVDTIGMPKEIILAGSEPQNISIDPASENYRLGLITIGFITLLFASNSPALHSAFELSSNTPPVLLINAIVSFVGLIGVVAGSPLLGKIVPDPSAQSTNPDTRNNATKESAPLSSSNNALMRIVGPSAVAGTELGLWKFLGTTANIYGLSQTSSDHGAFLIQLTTLIVPVAQGLMGVPIPSRIWSAIGLALGGVFMFTQDPSQRDCATLTGDGLCALAAIFYATYDLRLFKWGKIVPTNELITTKMMTQSLLSLGLLFVLGLDETRTFLSDASMRDLQLVGAVSLWSGFAVNALAPYLQVSGQQAVGPARAQILYASQPLWAAVMSYIFLAEQVGFEGFVGGIAFLCAMFLAATAENPDPDCGKRDCEV